LRELPHQGSRLQVSILVFCPARCVQRVQASLCESGDVCTLFSALHAKMLLSSVFHQSSPDRWLRALPQCTDTRWRMQCQTWRGSWHWLPTGRGGPRRREAEGAGASWLVVLQGKPIRGSRSLPWIRPHFSWTPSMRCCSFYRLRSQEKCVPRMTWFLLVWACLVAVQLAGLCWGIPARQTPAHFAWGLQQLPPAQPAGAHPGIRRLERCARLRGLAVASGCAGGSQAGRERRRRLGGGMAARHARRAAHGAQRPRGPHAAPRSAGAGSGAGAAPGAAVAAGRFRVAGALWGGGTLLEARPGSFKARLWS
jgi:hypothetical protein